MGGGTGLSALLSGLKHYIDPPAPGGAKDDVYFADVSALVTVTDDGGSSGRLRDEFQMLPPGDIRNCLVALSADESLLSSLFRYRFEGIGRPGGAQLREPLSDGAQRVLRATSAKPCAPRATFSPIRGRIFPSTNQSVSLRRGRSRRRARAFPARRTSAGLGEVGFARVASRSGRLQCTRRRRSGSTLAGGPRPHRTRLPLHEPHTSIGPRPRRDRGGPRAPKAPSSSMSRTS